MNIKIRVIPQASKNSIKLDQGFLKVYLTAPAVDGKANKALITFLSEYYKVRKNQIEIIKGLKSKDKTITISAI
ncbi:MAG: DUF167 domain-containing protein [Candidatus Omnitrophica bacterium]|nr:DUF167 domain-containing protein [Candidatus Omnitrophota bacterium]